MSLRNRKTGGRDPIADHEAELLEYINARDDDLVNYAKYFAHSKMALRSKVVEIDSDGFTLQYADRTSDNSIAMKEIRVPFDERTETKAGVLKKLASLAKEARSSLDLDKKVSKAYVAPTLDNLPRVENTLSTTHIAMTCGLWIVGLLGAFAPTLPEPLQTYREENGGQVTFERIIMGVLAVHTAECALVIAASIYGSFPFIDVLKSLFNTMVFGIGTLGLVVKTATSRKEMIDQAKEVAARKAAAKKSEK
ncbi:hypothetical protein BDZ88DRAFT_421582 [Geranomyces variabilis]|nr:hypothetical protein BDZ88DRAFT_421582 [Geranomyces variabilis]KAJ3140270.1 hypothetical protein HDU90_008497 [Geranomyces variabilis]